MFWKEGDSIAGSWLHGTFVQSLPRKEAGATVQVNNMEEAVRSEKIDNALDSGVMRKRTKTVSLPSTSQQDVLGKKQQQ